MHNAAVRLVGSSEAAWFLERGDHYSHLSSLRARQGRFAEAQELLQQAIRDARGDESELRSMELHQALLNIDLDQVNASMDALECLTHKCGDDHELLLEAHNCLGWLYICQGIWGRAKGQFEMAAGMIDCFAEGGVDLEMAIAFSGAAAAHMQLHHHAGMSTYESEAVRFLHSFPHNEVDGVQMVKYCLGMCKASRGCAAEASQLFAEALELQRKLFVADHPSNAVFEKSSELLPAESIQQTKVAAKSISLVAKATVR